MMYSETIGDDFFNITRLDTNNGFLWLQFGEMYIADASEWIKELYGDLQDMNLETKRVKTVKSKIMDNIDLTEKEAMVNLAMILECAQCRGWFN